MSGANRLITGAAVAAVAAAPNALAQPARPAPAAPVAADATKAGAIRFTLFRNQRIFLDGTVNGHQTPMMLDSGAGMTVVDRAFAGSIGLKGGRVIQAQGAGAMVSGEIATGVALEAGGLVLTGLNVLILDMASVARGIGRPVPVLLGRDAFKAGIVSIDFPGRRIRFANRSGFKPPKGAARLAVGESRGVPVIDIAIAGVPMRAQLDLGNGSTLVLSKQAWASEPALASLRHAAGEVGGVGGMKPSRVVTLPEVAMGEMRFLNVPATLNEDPGALPVTGANIGIGILKPYLLTIDWAGGALYLQGRRTEPFDRERVGARFELAGDRLRVAYVSPDGPAAAAGLKAGDEIVAVDGRRIDADYYDHADWSREPVGTIALLDRADGSRVRVTLADYF